MNPSIDVHAQDLEAVALAHEENMSSTGPIASPNDGSAGSENGWDWESEFEQRMAEDPSHPSQVTPEVSPEPENHPNHLTHSPESLSTKHAAFAKEQETFISERASLEQLLNEAEKVAAKIKSNDGKALLVTTLNALAEDLEGLLGLQMSAAMPSIAAEAPEAEIVGEEKDVQTATKGSSTTTVATKAEKEAAEDKDTPMAAVNKKEDQVTTSVAEAAKYRATAKFTHSVIVLLDPTELPIHVWRLATLLRKHYARERDALRAKVDFTTDHRLTEADIGAIVASVRRELQKLADHEGMRDIEVRIAGFLAIEGKGLKNPEATGNITGNNAEDASHSEHDPDAKANAILRKYMSTDGSVDIKSYKRDLSDHLMLLISARLLGLTILSTAMRRTARFWLGHLDPSDTGLSAFVDVATAKACKITTVFACVLLWAFGVLKVYQGGEYMYRVAQEKDLVVKVKSMVKSLVKKVREKDDQVDAVLREWNDAQPKKLKGMVGKVKSIVNKAQEKGEQVSALVSEWNDSLLKKLEDTLGHEGKTALFIAMCVLLFILPTLVAACVDSYGGGLLTTLCVAFCLLHVFTLFVLASALDADWHASKARAVRN